MKSKNNGSCRTIHNMAMSFMTEQQKWVAVTFQLIVLAAGLFLISEGRQNIS